MNKIEFHHVLPQVCALREDLVSDVWRQNVVFEIGQLYLVEADSGQGKSTFCSYIIGYRHDYSGQVLFDGADTLLYKVKDWMHVRQRHVSYLFQELRLFPELTAYENVEIKNKLTAWKNRKQIEEWFERLGIADKLNAKVGRMSFGQQQRVAMIRALVQPFDFLLADEPVSHLDDANASVMGEIMMEEARGQEAGVIITSIGKHIPLPYDKMIKL
ncbi:MAG: ATP-binding cassette domain-containing protein [Selenomonas sp.]|nr:ATP-binding cassette domain-containing protein [Selenomonas sp.]